jgi:hypothetical protein
MPTPGELAFQASPEQAFPGIFFQDKVSPPAGQYFVQRATLRVSARKKRPSYY